MQTFGLILDLVGVIFLIIGTEYLNQAILKIITTKRTQEGSIHNSLSEQINYKLLLENKRKAKLFNRLGYVLIALGFCAQLLVVI